MEPVPVTGLAANFSPIPLIAPPPFGTLSWGAEVPNGGSAAWLESGLLVAESITIEPKLSLFSRRYRQLRDAKSATKKTGCKNLYRCTPVTEPAAPAVPS